jgi:hypothetical protein
MNNKFRILSISSLIFGIWLIFEVLSTRVTAPGSNVINIGLIADRQLYLMLSIAYLFVSLFFVFIAFKEFLKNEPIKELSNSNLISQEKSKYFLEKIKNPLLITNYLLLLIIFISFYFPWKRIKISPQFLNIPYGPEVWIVVVISLLGLFIAIGHFREYNNKILNSIPSVAILLFILIYGLNVNVGVIKTSANLIETIFGEGFYISIVASVLLVGVNNYKIMKNKYFPS